MWIFVLWAHPRSSSSDGWNSSLWLGTKQDFMIWLHHPIDDIMASFIAYCTKCDLHPHFLHFSLCSSNNTLHKQLRAAKEPSRAAILSVWQREHFRWHHKQLRLIWASESHKESDINLSALILTKGAKKYQLYLCSTSPSKETPRLMNSQK